MSEYIQILLKIKTQDNHKSKVAQTKTERRRAQGAGTFKNACAFTWFTVSLSPELLVGHWHQTGESLQTVLHPHWVRCTEGCAFPTQPHQFLISKWLELAGQHQLHQGNTEEFADSNHNGAFHFFFQNIKTNTHRVSEIQQKRHVFQSSFFF